MEIGSDYSQAINAARALKSISNFTEAISAYKQSVKFKPNSFEALIELGITSWEMGNFDEAFAAA